MWKRQTVSVIFPTYTEKAYVKTAIEDFLASGVVDEVVVVNNNAEAGTDEEVRQTPARLVHEASQGYGYAIRKGLREATGDLLIIAEPDGTFIGNDVIKLLAYSDDFDYVLGTRTTKELIWEGANMGCFLKWGNWAVAKLTEALFNCPSLTDMGCTMRLIKRSALEQIRDQFTIGGAHFSPEMTLLVIAHRMKFIEIPVNYTKRVGRSTITGNIFVAVRLGLSMIGLVLGAWWRFVRRPRGLRAEGGSSGLNVERTIDD